MALILLAVVASPVGAHEFHLLGGVLEDPDSREQTYSWQIEYLEALGEHFAASISYLNEGHLPNHRRDGNSLQLWARANLLDRRLSLAAGAGPYYYYDTTEGTVPGSFTNDHGWGGMASLTATWYTESRWLFQLRTNWVGLGKGPDTVSALAGIGYQLEPPPSPGPLPKKVSQPEKTTNNEITLFIGQTIANSFESEESVAAGVEYRRGLTKYLDWTVGWLYEGDNRLIRRDGVTTQLWLVREFLDERVALGIGGGLYLALSRYHNQFCGKEADELLSGIVTMSASYRFHPHWHTRLSWNRVVTDYDRDTDVLLGGIGYRF